MKRLPWWKRPHGVRRALDIGAGHNPFVGTTHILEFDLKEGRERGGNNLVVPSQATLTVNHAESLPFMSQQFDYVYASHVLEHVDRPDRACSEIMRVGKAGYIETPSPLLEQGLARHDLDPIDLWFHKWLVFEIDHNGLVFEPKTAASVQEYCTCADGQFIKEFYDRIDLRAAQQFLRKKAKTTMFFWKTAFSVEVREGTVDCRRDGRLCRFVGMKRALLASCHDALRAVRIVRFRRAYPALRPLFRKYGYRTLFI